MTPAGRVCVVCQEPVLGEGIRIVRHSASGALPDCWVHAGCERVPLRPLRPRPRREA
ncbi:hypothetical protein GCM10010286_27120 [Streptomyces toxytricini]|nr:hypothetical protein GCM10010286_27120 [Streptomyces toxytricini]